MNRFASVAAIFVSLLLALTVLALVVFALGGHPQAVLSSMLVGAFGSAYGWSETLVRAVPILLCALAAAIPAETGQINIGGEGQFHLGAIGSILVVPSLIEYKPFLTMLLMVCAAIILGAVWAAIPAALRVWLGVSEALISLFLNYVAINLLQYLVQGPMRDPLSQGWPMSAPLSSDLVLRVWGETRVHSGIVVAIALALLFAVIIKLTRTGTELRATGLNPTASATVGIAVRRYMFFSMILGGALAGLAGFYEIAAVQHRLRPDISLGFGYSGFLVAWMCRQQVMLLVPVAVLVAGLVVGGENLQVTNGLPAAVGDVAQGLLLLFVVLSQPFLAWLERRRAIQLIVKSELA
jgi:general nucleoside transport system permease protein